jgi:hypothetical protein
MVDLVKIRKKVKDKLNANKEASGAAAVPAAEGEKNAAGVGGAPLTLLHV